MTDDGFLSRWSRRKIDARRGDRTATPAKDPTPAAPVTEPALTSEELAALPRPDALTAESDVTGFLRRGVPAALRNAALRRVWLLDPAIRDFTGHARDYDYDWNTPGGVPGNGALGPGDNVTAMVRRVLGEPNARPHDGTAAPDDRAARAAAGPERPPASDEPRLRAVRSPSEQRRDGVRPHEGDDHA